MSQHTTHKLDTCATSSHARRARGVLLVLLGGAEKSTSKASEHSTRERTAARQAVAFHFFYNQSQSNRKTSKETTILLWIVQTTRVVELAEDNDYSVQRAAYSSCGQRHDYKEDGCLGPR